MGYAVIAYRLGLAMGVLLAVWSGLSLVSASADGPFQVGLYVHFEDGSTFSQCVELEGVGATGLEVLRQAGIDLFLDHPNVCRG